MRFTPFRNSAVACILAGVCGLAIGQETDRIEWAFDADLGAIAAALDKAAAYAPHHATEQILLRRQYDIREDEAVTRVRRVWRLPTASSVQDFGAEEIFFDADRDSVRINVAATITPEGQARWLTRSDAQVGLDETPAVYTDMRRIDLWYPALEPGSLAIVDYTIRSSLDGAESIWSSRQLLRNLYPRREMEISGQWSEALEPRWTSDLEGLECAFKQRGFRCVGQGLAAVEYEEGVFWRNVIPEFIISLAPSWPAVIELATERFQRAFDELDPIADTVARLLDGAATRTERISRLHEFSARGIRYVSVSRHGSRITPKSVAETLESRLGDCKDKSALLIAMLAEAGIDAQPVLVATERTVLLTPDLADMHYFDHMVVCLNDGELCLDPTDAYTDSSVISPWIQGKVSLALKHGAKPSTIPARKYRWNLDIATKLRFDENGNQTETVRRRYKGEYAGAIRAQLQPLSETERAEWATQEYQESISSNVEPEFTFKGVDELSDELVIQSEAIYENLLIGQSPLPYNEPSPWVRREIQSIILENAVYTSAFAGLRVTARHRFDFPRQWQVAFAGPDLDFETGLGRYGRSSDMRSQQVTYRSLIELPHRKSVTPAEATRMNEALGEFFAQSNMHMIAVREPSRQ